jgi:hypothetical protein
MTPTPELDAVQDAADAVIAAREALIATMKAAHDAGTSANTIYNTVKNVPGFKAKPAVLAILGDEVAKLGTAVARAWARAGGHPDDVHITARRGTVWVEAEFRMRSGDPDDEEKHATWRADMTRLLGALDDQFTLTIPTRAGETRVEAWLRGELATVVEARQ